MQNKYSKPNISTFHWKCLMSVSGVWCCLIWLKFFLHIEYIFFRRIYANITNEVLKTTTKKFPSYRYFKIILIIRFNVKTTFPRVYWCFKKWLNLTSNISSPLALNRSINFSFIKNWKKTLVYHFYLLYLFIVIFYYKFCNFSYFCLISYNYSCPRE